MMVLGADMHKRSHTIAALAATTGELKGDKTIRVGDDGFLARQRAAELEPGVLESRCASTLASRHEEQRARFRAGRSLQAEAQARVGRRLGAALHAEVAVGDLGRSFEHSNERAASGQPVA
jgi:hypothetical protein